MNCVQRLNRKLHDLAPSLHHFVNFSAGLIDNSTPLPWNPKAFYAVNFILVLKSALSNLHSLPDICTDGMFRVDNSPRIPLEDEQWSGAIPEVVKEFLQWNFISNLGKFVDFLKGVIDLQLILSDINCLRLFKRIKIVRKF